VALEKFAGSSPVGHPTICRSNMKATKRVGTSPSLTYRNHTATRITLS